MIFCTASRWEQEEMQSERESKITEQDTAASHYNDLVRNMVSTSILSLLSNCVENWCNKIL